MMIRRGFTAVVVYLDDFFICAPTLDECNVAMNTLVALLRRLGFSINWDKVIDPTRCLTFLGIEIDTATMVKRLPSENVLALKTELEVFAKRKRASKRQLQSLAGKLGGGCGLRRQSIRPANFRRNLYITVCKSQMCINTRNAKGHSVLVGIYTFFQ